MKSPDEYVAEFRKKLSGYSVTQLERIYTKAYDRLCDWSGQSSAWDWPTLRLLHPQLALSMKAIAVEVNARYDARTGPMPDSYLRGTQRAFQRGGGHEQG